MDDLKRDLSKTKKTKTDHIKLLLQNYLHKRNYPIIGLDQSPLDQQLPYEISRQNSILFSCCNNDPTVIDHNFIKFCTWLRDLIKNKKTGHDLELLVAPLFCHLYLDVLKGGHAERAITFFKTHLGVIDRNKCDECTRDLINQLASDSDASALIEQFRGNKYFLELTAGSLDLLKRFVTENCHVVFLHVLQTWFDLNEAEDKAENEEDMDAQQTEQNGVCFEEKRQRMLEVIKNLDTGPLQILFVNIGQTNDHVTCGALDRTNGVLCFNQDNAVHVRSLHTYDLILDVHDFRGLTLRDHSKRLYAIVLAPDKRHLVTASEDSTMCIYDLVELTLIRTCLGHLGPVYCAAVSSNNAFTASGSFDTTARLWHLESGRMLRVFIGHNAAVTCLDFHPNCLYLATGSTDQNVRLWSIENGDPMRLFSGVKGAVYALAFSPLGQVLVSASDDKCLRFWDIMEAKLNHEIKVKGEPIRKVVWSQDGRYVCASSLDGVVRIWDREQVESEEPSVNIPGHCRVLALEYAFGTFAGLTC